MRPDHAHDLVAKSAGLLAIGGRVGIDVVSIPRLARMLDGRRDRMMRRWFTNEEQAYCGRRDDRAATTLAGKEAVMKVLGTGHRGIGWHDVEIHRRADGAPLVVLHGAAVAKAAAHAVEIEISLCHEGDLGIALAYGKAVADGS